MSLDAPPATLNLQTFTFDTLAVLAGMDLPVQLSVETYGTLSPARDNAILVCHYYTGTAHAAGRYGGDELPGWWDTLIGPGKALDTDRFFAVCMSTPANVQALDSRLVTTGPGTLAPDGQPWGERFPRWTFADLVELQCALMRSLGVPRWHAVVGPSLGGMQALQWAARYPALAPRVAAIATSPWAGVVLRDVFAPLLREVSAAGDLEGALRLITLFGLGADGLHAVFGDGRLHFAEYVRSRSQTALLSHVLDIARVVVTHDIREVAPLPELVCSWREANLRLLTVNVRGDGFFPCAEMREFARLTREAGVNHRHEEFDSPYGHLACLSETARFEASLRMLLDESV